MAEEFDSSKEPMLDIFIFETNQLLEQLEEILLRSEKSNKLSSEDINEIFRIMHTIKGSSAMMAYNNISFIAHAIEDLFDYIRHNANVNFNTVIDLVLLSLDFIKDEIYKIQSGKKADGNEKKLLKQIKKLLNTFMSKTGESVEEDQVQPAMNPYSNYIGFLPSEETLSYQKYKAKVFFEDGCQMENIRAFSFVFNLKDICGELYYRPWNIADDNLSSEYIAQNGFDIYFSSESDYQDLNAIFEQILLVKSYELVPIDGFASEISDILQYLYQEEMVTENDSQDTTSGVIEEEVLGKNMQQSLINVNTVKLDKLLDLVGEIVIAESMVSKNPDIAGLNMPNFEKAAIQLKKLIEELQDSVMSIRMIPIAETLHKMHRIVRDMSKKLNKEVELLITGEDTEVDKNIINHLADPLMHLIRNSMDHGIEDKEERIKKGKPQSGRISIAANNSGGEVTISISDDGKGLDKNTIIKQAKKRDLLTKPESELSDKEIYAFILHPGFSTKEEVTEFSGRGVGMDVVKENISKIGGSLSVESEKGRGMTVTIRIPLTLAIIDGMKIAVGKSIYTIPTISVREFFKAKEKDIVIDTDGNEMILIRETCYPILRIHKKFNIQTDITDLCEGIMAMIEWDDKVICLFADKLIGEQSVVAKPLPNFLNQYAVADSGIGGCTILGDGNISLIMDVKSLINQVL